MARIMVEIEITSLAWAVAYLRDAAENGPTMRSREEVHQIADRLQYGIEGEGAHDGHRCRLCQQLAGGDRNHRCWELASG